jgi:hypothetical protein
MLHHILDVMAYLRKKMEPSLQTSEETEPFPSPTKPQTPGGGSGLSGNPGTARHAERDLPVVGPLPILYLWWLLNESIALAPCVNPV